MNKPASMTIKEWLIKRMAIKMTLSEKVIEQVINFQFDSANSALEKNNTVEISGFGKFIFNTKKANKQYRSLLFFKKTYEETLANTDISEAKRKTTEVRLTSAIKDINLLKSKIQENGDN
jgi:hypothetical protein